MQWLLCSVYPPPTKIDSGILRYIIFVDAPNILARRIESIGWSQELDTMESEIQSHKYANDIQERKPGVRE